MTVVGLTRGSGVGTSGSAAGSAWGGSEWNPPLPPVTVPVTPPTLITTQSAAIADGAFATFTLTPKTGYSLSLSSISAHNIRRSSSGPSTGIWQYSIDGTTFTDIGSSITWGGVTNSAGNPQAAITLSGIAALQNIAVGTVVTFRVVNWNASGTGTWYFNNFQTGNDLVINGIETPLGPDLAPTIAPPLLPANNATDVSIGTNLVANFSENIVPILPPVGTIKLFKNPGSSPVEVESFLINSSRVAVSGNTLTINPTANLEYATSYYVTIATGMVEDATGNDFTGINTDTEWRFMTSPVPPPPAVVINKVFNTGAGNGAGDAVELLVTGSGSGPGAPVSLSGLFVKDFTNSVAVDTGGQYQFTNNSIWASVPVGTLVVLTRSGDSPDINSSDFSLSVGLDDTTYFTKSGGTFDISAREMVMVKTSASGATGINDSIHALAATDGTPTPDLFDATLPPKLLSATTIGSNAGVIATNPTSSIADFNGTNASTVPMTASALGIPNNTENLVYINALRGIIPGDGSGQATLVNATAGPFSGLSMFDDAQTDNQSVKLSITAQVPSVTLTTVQITVPTGMGAPSGATVTGLGAGTPSVVTTSQVVTISGLAVTNTNLIDITLNGLDTPVTNASVNGNLPFGIQTAIASGTLKSILSQPVAYVIIPIEAIRDVIPATGVPTDLNTVVAVEGVCTEAQIFNSNTLAFIQDGNFGVAAFNSSTSTPFTVGQKFAVLGRVSQFNGLTQVAYSSPTDVVNLGAGTNPTPLAISIPDLLLTPEAYEGRLVTVNNLTPAVWNAPVAPATSVTVAMQDDASPTPNPLTILITNGSGATTGPGGAANITGIFYQNDGSSPFTSGYQLAPREANDVDPLVSGFGAWIATFYPGVTDANIVGFKADPDGDGIPNGVEALIGGIPNVPGVFATSDLIKTGSVFTFLYPQDSVVPVGINATYQWSTDMATWQNSGASSGGVTVSLADELWDNSNPDITIYRVAATVTAGTAPKLFVRVGAID